MKRLGRAIDRFLYIVWRDWRDWYAFAWLVVIVAAVFGLGAATWTTVARYTAHDWHVFGVYALSEFLLLLPFTSDKTKKIRDLDGEVLVWTIDAIARHGYILDLRDRMLGDALGSALWGGGIGAGLLVGAVVVAHVAHHWRKAWKRRRGAGEKRAAMASRRWIGLALDSILRPLPACMRFVRKSITLRAFSDSTKRGYAKPTVGNRRAVDAAASGLEPGRRILAAPVALGDPTVGPFEVARSARQGRADAAEAPRDHADSHFYQRPDSEADQIPRDTPLSATSPPTPIASQPAAQSEPVNPSGSESTHSSGQDSDDVRVPQGGDSPPSGTGPSHEHQGAPRGDGADNAASSAPRGERVAPADIMPGSKGERPLGTRLGARRRRRRASQDFY